MNPRIPAVAGRFYPADPSQLDRVVSALLDESSVEPAPDKAIVAVAPHAGYPYSGPTAGHSFRRIAGMAPRRVILLGPSHHYHFPGFSIYPDGDWESPLGRVPVDAAFAGRLIARFGNCRPDAHAPEHALEVELPFLQRTLVPGFAIVPILLGEGPAPRHMDLAAALAEWVEAGDLVIASTDLSHFLSESAANRIDRQSLALILDGDPEGVRLGQQDQTCSMCGASAVYTAMAFAQYVQASQRTLWDYRTSGQATGDFERVVGYGAITLERSEAA